MRRFPRRYAMTVVLAGYALLACTAQAAEIAVQQITQGPLHHFYGYIGHVGNTPWDGTGQFMVVLRTHFQDRMPEANESADLVLLDAHDGWRAERLDETRAWNFQQGSMLYWDPEAPDRRFFFNDRDPATNGIFCVLYDIKERKRIREYRFDESPIGNSGVSQRGGFFLALNYGRLARLRPVTGYPGAWDWTAGEVHPEKDGIWKVDVATGGRDLLISYRKLAEALRPRRPDIDAYPLFINHTLCNREATSIFAFMRGGWEGDPRPNRIDVPFTINLETKELKFLPAHIGGHPEWAPGNLLVGSVDGRQVLFDPLAGAVAGTIGTPESIPRPGGDVALSPDGKWLINGRHSAAKSCYSVVGLETGEWFATPCLDIGTYKEGELRIDPAPCWNRDGSAFASPGLAPDGTRQTFVFQIDRR
ncbi:MAG: hypothetical protein IT364_09110 [Candidatus Hydrogenedentes bacterium]|nr:hypothetical protein [Candidatus Hydrogenedentota bacterium]